MEIHRSPGILPPVLFLPGGHCTAHTPVGQQLYAELGHEVVSVSRPGYGRTAVGPLTVAEFTPVLRDAAAVLGIERFAAVVGVSFGGLQAVDVARSRDLADRLVLHSCAPSRFAFPDTVGERVGAALAFGASERMTWAMTRRLVGSDRGLRLLMKPLSALPPSEWFDEWGPAERSAAREVFLAMASGGGFRLDLRQAVARLASEREAAQRAVVLPTLVTFSPKDGSVADHHARNFAATIPHARLVELPSPTHFFWVGAGSERATEAISQFMGESA